MAETTSSAAAAKLAMAEITAAAAAIPAAWPIARIVYMNQCDPETIMSRGGGDWMAIAEQLGTVPGKLDGAVSAVSAEQWSGEDRSAFEGHTKAYGVQVVAIQILATTVSVTMISVGVILLCLVVAYAIVSTILALWAAFILAAAATVVGAPVAASALASANSFAASALGVLQGIERAVNAAATAGAAAIAGAAAFDVGAHLGSGDTDVLKDLVHATIDGADDALAGFMSKLERDFAGYGIHTSGRHAASPNGPSELMYGLVTQTGPTVENGDGDGDGDVTFGTGGVVDNIWQRGFDGNIVDR